MAITFKEICRYYFDTEKNDGQKDRSETPLEDAFLNFYKTQGKNFNNILDGLGIRKEFRKIMSKRNNNLTEEDKLFIVDILKKFKTLEIRSIRNKFFDNLEPKYIVYIVDNFSKIAIKSNLNIDSINDFIEKLYANTNYFSCKRKLITETANNKITDLFAQTVQNLKNTGLLTYKDRNLWQANFFYDLNKLIIEYGEIYFNFKELREAELIDSFMEERHELSSEKIFSEVLDSFEKIKYYKKEYSKPLTSHDKMILETFIKNYEFKK